MKHQSKLQVGLMMPCILSFSLIGCAIKKPVTIGFCDVSAPIYASRFDLMTPETERQILEHNLLGKRLCAWGKKKSVD
ncbi:TPA: hypothetical protein MHT92_03010 [Klebsiella pneumoniae]|nr:hypothetical protein [Klebsiella pneumoniae]